MVAEIILPPVVTDNSVSEVLLGHLDVVLHGGGVAWPSPGATSSRHTGTSRRDAVMHYALSLTAPTTPAPGDADFHKAGTFLNSTHFFEPVNLCGLLSL